MFFVKLDNIHLLFVRIKYKQKNAETLLVDQQPLHFLFLFFFLFSFTDFYRPLFILQSD